MIREQQPTKLDVVGSNPIARCCESLCRGLLTRVLVTRKIVSLSFFQTCPDIRYATVAETVCLRV